MPCRCRHPGCPDPITHPPTGAEVLMESLITAYGEYVIVSCGGRSWKVPRRYVGLHGLAAKDLPTLGFEEVTGYGQDLG